MSVKELQAVVLAAGQGSRLTELTVSRPKCLLPVGQHPILYHSLLLLEKTGFKDAIVIVLSSALSQINAELSRCKLKINAELVAIPSEAAEEWGTAESLQYLVAQERIKSDVLIVSCDIYTNGNLTELLQKFREHKASFAALFFHPLNDSVLAEVPPGIKSKNKPERDIVGIDAETSRLVFLSSASDFEELVPFKTSILRRHPKISLRTDLLDGHIYVLAKKLVKFLSPATSFSTLKGEFLPYVVGKQHTRAPSDSKPEKLALFHESMKEERNEETMRDNSSYNDHRGDTKSAYHGDSIRCYAVVAHPQHYAFRINSIPSLWHANRLVTNSEPIKDTVIDQAAQVLSNQVAESFIGSESKIAEKTSVRGSVLSERVNVQAKSRILRSTVLRRVAFSEGCVIENCVIGNDVVVEDNCELKNCVVGANHRVKAGTKATFQILTESDRLMEI